jgi:hypothetical protein
LQHFDFHIHPFAGNWQPDLSLAAAQFW